MNAQKQTILVVDDETDLREAIAFDLKRKGYQVLQATNGLQALEVVENNVVNLVISDVRMPGGSGVELLEKLKEKNAFFPVLMFISGFSDMTPEEAYDKGAEAVFAKPFDRKLLHGAVVRCLEPMNERLARKAERIPSEMPVGLKFPKTGIALDSKILNLGRGGMFVLVTENFPSEDEPVEFHLQLPSGGKEEIKGQGMVRWVRRNVVDGMPPGCGIEFDALESEGMKCFLELVKSLNTKPYIPKR